ncbi:enolase C-terminal domain-like protein [Fodinibius sediminis]|uniref:Mannonate dehydratase n=1 Tax=Fodinibius sediminis TaxID=1214077 RepID=A0A521BD67_9BACT|nr:enolase C-terminal domain-like protein [Fodinibius sediminis]SMO45034.1 mannonate dehydratase [Fodinibius sediminis]
MDRRDAIKNMSMGLSAGALGGFSLKNDSWNKNEEKYTQATNGLPPLEITNVKAIATAPEGIELIVVKVETSEPGLYGLGCATFRQRARPVVSAVDDYLHDLCVGMNVNNIENIWQMAYQSSYWRNGPVLNNALSGLDQALWDIKGKRANMPVYELLGGKVRFAVDTYTHAGADTIEEVIENVKGYMDQGYRHVRIQWGGYGSSTLASKADFKEAGFGMERDQFIDPQAYLRGARELFAKVREEVGNDVELLHDIHERIQPIDAINLLQDLEQYRPFFIEDPLSPENMDYFKQLRAKTSVPIAMGELLNNPHEWLRPMSNRWFDFIRIHISQIGGITPAMKVARLGEWFNVRTAWHGPGDVSPVGHAANAHIDLAVWNFGIQEAAHMVRDPSEQMQEVFSGIPRVENGYMHVNEAPGLGVDIDEEAAANYPIPDQQLNEWTQIRNRDGTPIRP